MEKGQDNKVQGKIHLFFAVLAMFLLVVSLLLTSVQIAVYGDAKYRFYEKEYVKYNVTEPLGMELSDVMAVTDYMMEYLIGRKDKLSIETDVDGRRQDFFNEQDRIHMEDVRKLFLGGLKLRTALFFASLLLIGMLAVKKADVPRLLPVAYKTAMAVLAAAFAFLGISFYIDFTKCFTIFHEIFFTNDLWIFDETTDYMIRMLPEGFFSDMAIRIAAVFAVSLALLGGAVWLVRTAAGRRPFGGIVRLRSKNQR